MSDRKVMIGIRLLFAVVRDDVICDLNVSLVLLLVD